MPAFAGVPAETIADNSCSSFKRAELPEDVPEPEGFGEEELPGSPGLTEADGFVPGCAVPLPVNKDASISSNTVNPCEFTVEAEACDCAPRVGAVPVGFVPVICDAGVILANLNSS